MSGNFDVNWFSALNCISNPGRITPPMKLLSLSIMSKVVAEPESTTINGLFLYSLAAAQRFASLSAPIVSGFFTFKEEVT